MDKKQKCDSSKDTKKHIKTVRMLIGQAVTKLLERSIAHDKSKLQPPEKEMFDIYTPKLQATTYGSDEYKSALVQMGVALKHHYEVNQHHPEHYEHGLCEMSLIDIFEMLADWKAAGLRHADGDMLKSLEINRVRFGISAQLHDILINTVREMQW
jgi:hypothetical protein